MSETLEISTVRQLRLFNAIETRSVYEAMLEVDGAVSAREIADRVGMSAESAHYHLGKLLKLKIVVDRGRRESGARPERLYGLRYRHVELKRGKRSPAYIRELVRGVRLLLRKSEREYEQGWVEHPNGDFRPCAVRSVAWIFKEDIEKLKKLEVDMVELMMRADRAHRSGVAQKRERMAITVIMSPIGTGGNSDES